MLVQLKSEVGSKKVTKQEVTLNVRKPNNEERKKESMKSKHSHKSQQSKKKVN